jgi:hypothetical protein
MCSASIHVPQLLNGNDAFVLEPNTCAENRHLLPIPIKKTNYNCCLL